MLTRLMRLKKAMNKRLESLLLNFLCLNALSWLSCHLLHPMLHASALPSSGRESASTECVSIILRCMSLGVDLINGSTNITVMSVLVWRFLAALLMGFLIPKTMAMLNQPKYAGYDYGNSTKAILERQSSSPSPFIITAGARGGRGGRLSAIEARDPAVAEGPDSMDVVHLRAGLPAEAQEPVIRPRELVSTCKYVFNPNEILGSNVDVKKAFTVDLLRHTIMLKL